MNIRALCVVLIVFACIPALVTATTFEAVSNGDFSSGLTDWTTYVNYPDSTSSSISTTAVGGDAAIFLRAQQDIHGRTPYVEMYQTVDLTAANTLTFKALRYSGSTSSALYVYIDGVLKKEVTQPSMTEYPTYTTYSVDISSYSGSKQVMIKYIGIAGSDTSVIVDDISVLATVSVAVLNSVTATPDSGHPSFDSTLSASVTPGYPTSTTYTWSILPATGWSYKSGYSASSTSPQITISSVGDYTVSCSVSNGYGSSGGHSDTITATTATYNLTVNLLNETGDYFLTSSDISITSGDAILHQNTTSTGTHTFTGLADGTYGVMAECDGYEDKFQYKQVDGEDLVVNYTMVSTESSTSSSGASYAPHYVQVLVTDGLTPLANAKITATVEESSGPLDWLTDWIGLSDDIEITGTTLTGQTDSNGAISFQMIQSLKYKVTISKDGYDSQTAYIYPTENQYSFNLGGSTAIFADGDDDPNEIVLTTLNSAIISDTQVNFVVTYEDTQNQTTFCNLSVLDQERDQVAFKSYYGNNDLSHTFIIHDYAGESYFIRIEAEQATFGTVTREYTRTFPELLTFGLPSDLLMYAAFAIIVFTGLLFSMGNVAVGGIIVCFEGWIFFFIGWLNELGTVVLMPLILFTIMVFIQNFKDHERKEGY